MGPWGSWGGSSGRGAETGGGSSGRRARCPQLLPRAAPGVPRRAASPARAAALGAAGRPSERGFGLGRGLGRGPGRGGGRRPQRPPAAPGARSRGGGEAARGRNHEPEFPQVSDPALLRLQRGGSQEQGEPAPALCTPANEWAPRGGRLGAAGGTRAGGNFGARAPRRDARGSRRPSRPPRTQSPAARWVPLEPGAGRAARAPDPRGSGSFVPRAGDDPARRTVEGRRFPGDPGAAPSGAVGDPGGPGPGGGPGRASSFAAEEPRNPRGVSGSRPGPPAPPARPRPRLSRRARPAAPPAARAPARACPNLRCLCAFG